MYPANYQRLTIRSGDCYFSLFCTQHSLDHRLDEVVLWADSLARHLHWRMYETTLSSATAAESMERPQALFDHRFPVAVKN